MVKFEDGEEESVRWMSCVKEENSGELQSCLVAREGGWSGKEAGRSWMGHVHGPFAPSPEPASVHCESSRGALEKSG